MLRDFEIAIRLDVAAILCCMCDRKPVTAPSSAHETSTRADKQRFLAALAHHAHAKAALPSLRKLRIARWSLFSLEMHRPTVSKAFLLPDARFLRHRNHHLDVYHLREPGQCTIRPNDLRQTQGLKLWCFKSLHSAKWPPLYPDNASFRCQTARPLLAFCFS